MATPVISMGRGVPSTRSARGDGAVVGNRHTRKYHMPTCGSTAAILPQKSVESKSAAEATAAGYTPCGACKP